MIFTGLNPMCIDETLSKLSAFHKYFQVCDGQPTKATRMMQAEEAVSRIKVCFTVRLCLVV